MINSAFGNEITTCMCGNIKCTNNIITMAMKYNAASVLVATYAIAGIDGSPTKNATLLWISIQKAATTFLISNRFHKTTKLILAKK